MQKRSKLRICLADDNPQICFMMEYFLREAGHEVYTFSDGELLVQSLDLQPDAIFLDYRFPGTMNGMRIFEIIKKSYPKIPVVFLSGQNDPDIAINSLKSGAFDYIIKDEQFPSMVGKAVKDILDDLNRPKTTLLQNSFNKFLDWLIPAVPRYVKRVQSSKALSMIILLLSSVLLTSCSQGSLGGIFTPKKQNKLSWMELCESPGTYQIRPDDKITVSIWNNEDLSVGSVFGIYNSNEVYGKWLLVDQNGEVVLPKIGRMQVGGLDCVEAASQISTILEKEIRDPVVVVKVLNREVTLTGEFNDPRNYSLDKEVNRLPEVMGLAGGPTDYANIKKIKLTRNCDGYARSYSINLKQLTPAEANAIIVQPGDIIHAPAGKGKFLEKKAPLLIPVASLLSGVAILISVTGR